MQVIRTHDGLVGIKVSKEANTIWIESLTMLEALVHSCYIKLGNECPTKREVEREVSIALDYMAQHNHTVAEFGVLGSFMYTEQEEEA
jgi:hypothetical protein